MNCGDSVQNIMGHVNTQEIKLKLIIIVFMGHIYLVIILP